ncbi:hypothetical protein BS47DRAFT_1365776 [Hydnum rufescens UP504]|uniref:Uncharacterized protein n=1 Tax=Hydnum rufescens UP504 TaxID=1448309 RepID=A0A9P6DRQ2_9AGAM|nr:hypothetical protein BS47DRAFT_1365776 [Hydnum rufescens UP504]
MAPSIGGMLLTAAAVMLNRAGGGKLEKFSKACKRAAEWLFLHECLQGGFALTFEGFTLTLDSSRPTVAILEADSVAGHLGFIWRKCVQKDGAVSGQLHLASCIQQANLLTPR